MGSRKPHIWCLRWHEPGSCVVTWMATSLDSGLHGARSSVCRFGIVFFSFVRKKPCRRQGLAGVFSRTSCLVSTLRSHPFPHERTIASQLALCQLALDAWSAGRRGLAPVLWSAIRTRVPVIECRLDGSSRLGACGWLSCSGVGGC